MVNFIAQPSPNFDTRPDGQAVDMVILHYTNMPDSSAALARLGDKQAKVSAHYLIDEAGQIYALVDEAHRAWHAGEAFWAGMRDINGRSLGVELAHCGPDESGQMAAYPKAQMQALLELLGDFARRYEIPPQHYLGHSDVAPARKADPGAVFDWPYLAAAGFGLVSQADAANAPALSSGMKGDGVRQWQSQLAAFGYECPVSGHYDDMTEKVTAAFQRHFRPHQVDGVADAQSHARLLDLLAQTH